MGKLNGKDSLIEICDGKSGSVFVSRKKLIEDHYYIAEGISSGMKLKFGSRVEFDDLLSDASFGLIDAADRYDISHNALFSTYAKFRVKGEVLDGMRSRSPNSRLMSDELKLFEEAFLFAGMKVGQKPDVDDVIEELSKKKYVLNRGNKLEGVEKAEKICRDVMGKGLVHVYGIHNVRVDYNNKKTSLSFLETLGKNTNFAPFSRLNFDRISEGLTKAEKNVLRLYYVENMTFKETGMVLGRTTPNMHQIHGVAIRKIKDRLEGIYEEGLRIVCK